MINFADIYQAQAKEQLTPEASIPNVGTPVSTNMPAPQVAATQADQMKQAAQAEQNAVKVAQEEEARKAAEKAAKKKGLMSLATNVLSMGANVLLPGSGAVVSAVGNQLNQ